MNRLSKPKNNLNYGFIEISLKLPSRLDKVDKQYLKKNLKISLANKFNSPEDLENYVKGKHGKPIQKR